MYFPPALHKELVAKVRPKPSECFYCEYDRKIDVPEGGWMYMGNNAVLWRKRHRLAACGVCVGRLAND